MKEGSLRHPGERAKVGVEGVPGMSRNSKAGCCLGLSEQGEEVRSRSSGGLGGRPHRKIGKPLEGSRGDSECSTENRLREGNNG